MPEIPPVIDEESIPPGARCQLRDYYDTGIAQQKPLSKQKSGTDL